MSSVSSLNSLLSGLASASTPSSINLSALLQAATGATSAGIDVTSAVDAAIYAAQAPERQWQSQQSSIAAQISAFTSIQTALSSLSNEVNALNDVAGPLSSRTVTSSGSTQVTATAASGAAVGKHMVAVQALASTASWYSPEMPSSTSALGSSTLTITASDGSQTTFSTGSGTNSLQDLASAINASSAGVAANVVSDANGSRLALVSAKTGSAADFTVTYGSAGGSAWSSVSVASASAALPAGSFQIGDGTSSAAITVSSGDTLSAIATKINAQGLGLTANVLADASGAHLEMIANPGNSVSVSADPAFSMTRASTGTNASLTVDGIPISSASNTVAGVVSGLTLNLTSTTGTGGAVTLSVDPDTTQVTQALSKFISDYNSALSLVSSQFTYSSTSGSQGVLSGNSTVRSLQSSLLGIAAYSPSASTGSSSAPPSSILSLADLGISMQDDGSLTLDTAALNAAMANTSAVQSFFQGASLNGFAQQASKAISAFNNPATGSIANEVNNLKQQYANLQTEVNDYESGYIASQRTVLTAMYSQAEIALEELPAQMKQLQAQFGNSGNGG